MVFTWKMAINSKDNSELAVDYDTLCEICTPNYMGAILDILTFLHSPTRLNVLLFDRTL